MAETVTSAPSVPAMEEKRTSPPHICMYVLGKGRTDVRVMREAVSLVQAGLKVTLIDIEADRQPREELVQGVRLKHAHTPFKRLLGRSKPWLLTKASQMLGSMFTVLRTPADVYHAHDVTALPACYLAAVLRRKILVYDAHELPVSDPSFTRRPFLRRFTTLLLRVMVPRCNGVITVSPPIVGELQRRYGGPKAVVVRNLPVYQPPVVSDRLRRFLDLDASTRIALYQGGLQPNRTLDKLVYAAPFLAPNTLIVLLGWGPTQERLASLIQETGASDRVKMVPRVPYEELLEWTASADIGLTLYSPDWSLNVKFCLPNKFFEYLMVGLPVLTAPLDAIVDILQRYEVGRVAPSLEPEMIGNAINAMLADTDALTQMRANALKATATDLHWDAERQQLITLYQQLVGVPAASALIGRSG